MDRFWEVVTFCFIVGVGAFLVVMIYSWITGKNDFFDSPP